MLCDGSEHGEEGGVGGAVDVKLEQNVKNINIKFSFRSLISELFLFFNSDYLFPSYILT